MTGNGLKRAAGPLRATSGGTAVAEAVVAGVGGLVLSRRLGESIMIGEAVEVEVAGIKSATVRLRVIAPREVTVHRIEVYRTIQAAAAPIEPAPSYQRPETTATDQLRRGQGGLVLTRHLGESIMIGDDVEVEVIEVRPNTVRLRINAPRAVPVHRREIREAMLAEV